MPRDINDERLQNHFGILLKYITIRAGQVRAQDDN